MPGIRSSIRAVVQAIIDPIAFVIEPIVNSIATIIEAIINPITPVVEPVIDSITTIIETFLDPVAALIKTITVISYRVAAQHRHTRAKQDHPPECLQIPCVHRASPFPKSSLSVGYFNAGGDEAVDIAGQRYRPYVK